MKIPLLERHADDISGVFSCYDRIIITGTVPEICYAGGMTGELYRRGVRIFDFENFAKPFAEEMTANAGRLAEEAGIEIEYIPSPKKFRKEDRIAEILRERGTEPGLVHIFSVLETCNTYRPWHDKNTGKTFLRPRTGKCLHYYFYFIDPVIGLCYLRVPTWIPFRLQFYCNGHNVLAAKLAEAGIPFTQTDNTFPYIADASTGSAQVSTRHRNWRTVFPRKNCTPYWTDMPHYIVRSSGISLPAAAGALCRWNTQPTSCSKPRKLCRRCTKI